MDNFTLAEKNRLHLIQNIQSLRIEGCNISEIARRLGKDRRTIRRYLSGDPRKLSRYHRQRQQNPYEKRIIELIQEGYIQKQIIELLIQEGYNKSYSAIKHTISSIIRKNHLEVNKYCNTKGTKCVLKGAVNSEYKYIHRTYIFKYLWMNAELSYIEKESLFNKYPILITLANCIREFREIYRHKNLSYLYLFLDKYIASPIKELSSFAHGIEKDLETVENSVSSDLSNGFVEGVNNKLKMVKRTMYGRCNKELLTAKMMLQ